MKRFISVLFFVALFLCGCSSVSADGAELVYNEGQVRICTVLTDEEAEAVASAFDNKLLYSDNPSCGFSADYSITCGGREYWIAGDSCTIVKDCESGKFFTISESDRTMIDELVEKYSK